MGFITSGSTIWDVADWVLNGVLHDNSYEDFAVQTAVDAYRTLCGKIPFETLRKTSAEIAITQDVGTYDLDTFLTDSVAGLISVRLTITSTHHRKLQRSHPSVFDRISNPNSGQPALYARMGNTIELHPVPSLTTYKLRLRYWKYPDINEDKKTTVLEIPAEWEELLKWETLYRMYNGPLQRPDAAMALVAPTMLPDQPGVSGRRSGGSMGIIPRLWNDLERTIQQREHIDENFSINPTQRGYTAAPYGW